MIKKFASAVIFLLMFFKLSAQDFIPLKYVPTNLEIEVMNVNVNVVDTDEDFASYLAKLPEGNKLSCVENRGTFRVRSIYRTSGQITIKIPKTKKLEHMRIVASLATINVENISVVHTHIVLTRGDINVQNCFFKTSNLTHNTGKLEFSAGVKSSALCISNVIANVKYLGETNDYHLDYSQAFSNLATNGDVITKKQGQLGRQNSVKRALLSVSASAVNVSFPQ